jgi:hypothetical protein
MNVKLSHKQTITVIRYGLGRLKASCERGSILVNWENQWMFDDNAKNACEQLITKFAKEDIEKYGSCKSWNNFVGGEVKDMFVFVNSEGF